MKQDVRPAVHDLNERAGELAERAGELAERAGELAERAVETAAPVVGSAVEVVSERVGDVLETSLVRGSAAWDALRGGPVGPPVGVRRWPWAVSAALAGAAAGAAAALLVRRLLGEDAPGAQEPEDLEAVVDRPTDVPPPA